MSKRSLVAMLSSMALVVACGATSSPAADGMSCEDIQRSASEEVQKAIAANLSCQTDADCVAVAFATDCFDSCTRSTNKNGPAAVDAAKASVNGQQCKSFSAQGCRKTVPPCVPPMAPTCVSGACQ